MKVLFSTKDEGEEPTVLSTGEPLPPDTSDTAYTAAMTELVKRAGGTAAARQTRAETLAALSKIQLGAGSAAAIASIFPKYDFTDIFPKPAFDVASIMPKYDFTDVFPKLALDVASIMPKYDFTPLLAAFDSASLMAPYLDAGLSTKRQLDAIARLNEATEHLPRLKGSADAEPDVADGLHDEDRDPDEAEED